MILIIDKIGHTMTHDRDTLLILDGDMPPDKVVLFLNKVEFGKIASQFDVQVMK